MKISISETFTSDFWRAQLVSRYFSAAEKLSGELTIVDLFSGCGGLSLGAAFAARQLGKRLNIKLAVDSWLHALNVYNHNFAEVCQASACADIRDINAKKFKGVDVVVAGPPCQGHSDLNNSTRRVDERNELYISAVDFAIKCLAKMIVIENVPAVVHSKQKVVPRAKETLKNEGYAVSEIVIDVSKLGVPQQRKRHLLLGSRVHMQKQLDDVVETIAAINCKPKLLDFISDLHGCNAGDGLLNSVTRMSAESKRRIDYLFDNDEYDLPNELRPPCHRDKAHSYSSMYGRMRPNKPAQTITSGFGSMGQGRFVHPTQRRTITPHEAARIQGFPDFFNFSGAYTLTSLREMIANAVPPVVAATVLVHMISTARTR